MKFLSLLIPLPLLVASTCSDGSTKVLTGATGVGKSYGSGIMGCPMESCSTTSSCTMAASICCNGQDHVIDNVGSGYENTVEVDLKGISTPISGLIYPAWSLLELLETNKISEIELFTFVDANNPRGGESEKILTEILRCPSKVVLTKFRDDEPEHLAIYEDFPDAAIIRNHQKSDPKLEGTKCRVFLPPDWRERLISNDFTALRAVSDRQYCSDLEKDKKDLEAKVGGFQDRHDFDTNGCKRRVCSRMPGCIFVGFHSGFCMPYPETCGDVDDQDCIHRRDEHNRRVHEHNERMQAERQTTRDRINWLENEMKEKCSRFPVNV